MLYISLILFSQIHREGILKSIQSFWDDDSFERNGSLLHSISNNLLGAF